MRANSLKVVIALFVWQAAKAEGWAAGGEAGPAKIEPDPQLQVFVDRIARTRRFTPEYFEIVADLHKRIREQGRDLQAAQKQMVLQALHYSAHTKSEVNEFGGGFESRGALDVVVWALGLAKVNEIDVLAPYLESSDEEVRSLVLGYISNGAAQPDVPQANDGVRALLMYLTGPAAKNWRNAPPATAVRILYQSAPTAAFHFYVERSFQGKNSTEKIREMYWADHVIHDVIWKIQNKFLKLGETELAIVQLDRVSQVEGWWAKRYVVEMMRRHKELRNEKILERLRKDQNPLVSKAASEPFPPDQYR